MNSIYHTQTLTTMNNKLLHFSPKLWRIIYLIKTNNIHHTSAKRIKTRNSVIPVTFLNSEVLIYSGKRWTTRNINIWNVGFRFGEFTWNRKYALFKSKAKKKKKK